MTVTPVRATNGSSCQTVVCPTLTPATSVMALRAPVGRGPTARPTSRTRHGMATDGSGRAWKAGSTMFAVWSDDCERHDPAGEVWLGVWTPGTEGAGGGGRGGGGVGA